MYTTMLQLIIPEIFVASMACIILLLEVFLPLKRKFRLYLLTIITLFVVALLTISNTPQISQTIFNNSFIVDNFATCLKVAIYLMLAFSLIYCKVYMQTRDLLTGEFLALSLLSMLGMMIVISAANFLSLYLGLELIVLPLYTLIVLIKNKPVYAEAAMKYFVLGSLGSGIMLFGISLVYGAVGSISFSAIAEFNQSNTMLNLGMLLVIIGLGVEFGAVPFHMWLPDVYEGSPTVVTMIIGTIPKIAVFAMVYRLLTLAFTNLVPDWQQLFLIIALLSIALGNVAAIAQTNIKRMLAYSTIGHIGFILLGLFVAQHGGYVAPIFYTLSYTIMALAAFAVIVWLSDRGFEADKISDFAGLNQRAPWVAFIMLLIMFSLAGVPPMLGFYAKFLILQNVVEAGYPGLAALALVFTIMGAFYYLRIIKVMYFEAPAHNAPSIPTASMSKIAQVLVSFNGLALLFLGIFPGIVFYWCMYALQ